MEFLMTKTIVMEFFVLICPLCGQANERIVFVEGFSTLFSIWWCIFIIPASMTL